jgi:hypothetical protein
MSPKQARKFHGIRRGDRRRGWTRWFREGVLENEARSGARQRRELGSSDGK